MPTILGVNFGVEVSRGPETLEKQGRSIHREDSPRNSLRNLWAMHCISCTATFAFLHFLKNSTNEKLHCNIEKAALQESGAFLSLSCGFQAPTFRPPRNPRLGPAECDASLWARFS